MLDDALRSYLRNNLKLCAHGNGVNDVIYIELTLEGELISFVEIPQVVNNTYRLGV